MQMNKHNRLVLISLPILVLLASLILPPVLAGAENEPPQEAVHAAPATEDVQQTLPDQEIAKNKQAEAASKTAARPIKEFKPSETIGADSAVAFPIDI